MKKNIYGTILIISIMILSIIAVFYTTDIHELTSLVYHTNYVWYLYASMLSILVWLVDAFHLQVISNALFEKTNFNSSFKFSMIGYFYNSVTPFSSGGQPAQAYYMSKSGIAPGHAITILIIKSAMYQFTVTVYSLCAFLLNKNFLINMVPHFMVFFLIGTIISAILVTGYIIIIINQNTAISISIFLLKILHKLRIVKDLEKAKEDLEKEIECFSEGMDILRNNLKTLLASFAIQAFQLTVLFCIPFAIYTAIETDKASLFDFITSQAPLRVISAMVPLPGATGGAEGMSYLFFKNLFKTAPLAAVILLWRIFTFYINIIGGGLVYAFMPDKKFANKIRRKRKQYYYR